MKPRNIPLVRLARYPRAARDAQLGNWYWEFRDLERASRFWNMAIDGGIVVC